MAGVLPAFQHTLDQVWQGCVSGHNVTLIPHPHKGVSSDTRLEKMPSEIEFLRKENKNKIDLHRQEGCVVEMR